MRPMTHGVPRRGLLGAGLLAALLPAAGCSLLPGRREGGEDLTGMLSRIGAPFLVGESETLLAIGWARPAAIREVLGIPTGEEPEDLAARGFLRVLEQIDPMLVSAAASASLPGVDTLWLQSADRLLAPSAVVSVDRRRDGNCAVWTGAASLLDGFEEAFGEFAARDGDQLVLEPERAGRHLIAVQGEDLVITSAESVEDLEGRRGVDEQYADLPRLLDVLDLEDAHMLTSAVLPPVEDDEHSVREQLVATRIDSADTHTTRGAVRTDGDAEVLAERILQSATTDEGEIGVIDVQVDGDMASLEFSATEPDSFYGWQALRLVHGSHLETSPRDS